MQQVIVGILVLAALIYLTRYFVKINKNHKCDDCGLMEMQKKKKLKDKG